MDEDDQISDQADNGPAMVSDFFFFFFISAFFIMYIYLINI